MKKPKCQLVLQFPCASADEFDLVIQLEESLLQAVIVADPDADVDGHDYGSGEANIFIITQKPTECFSAANIIVRDDFPCLASGLRAAFRPADKEKYTVLWPAGLSEFSIA